MRRTGFRVVLLTLMASACHDPSDLRRVRAMAAIDTSALDFGDVPVGEWREADVHVENIGFVEFNAMDALQLQGNPSFQVVLDPGKIKSGEQKTIRVRFHPLLEGPLADSVVVHTDADRQGVNTFSMKGKGAPPPVQINPSTLDFQNLEVDSDRTLVVTVVNPIDLPLTLALDGPQAPQFGADVVTVPPLSTQTVKVQYAPHVLGGSKAAVEVHACANCTPIPVPMSGTAVSSAFQFDPAPVLFANVPVHESTQSTTHATNITWRPVLIKNTLTSDPAFTAMSNLGGQFVQPGGSVEVPIQFSARSSGPSLGTLSINYVSDKPRRSDVILDARGGRPTLSLAPVEIDFGDLPVGGKLGKPVRLTNAGTAGDLHFKGLRATGDTGNFSASEPMRGKTSYAWSAGSAWPTLAAPDLPIAPGNDYLDAQLYFEPEAPGDFQATVYFQSDDPFNPERPVNIRGHAHLAGPCQFRVTPSTVLDFGDVPATTGAVLGFRFMNTGTTECAVKDIFLSQDAGGVFFMPGGALTGGVLEPGDWFSAQIAFKSPTPGSFAGQLSITVNDPAQPLFTLPLKALAEASCLTAAPNYLDFGAIRLDCPVPSPRSTFVMNQCQYPIAVSSVTIGAGTSDQFSITQAPTTPLTLQPAQGFEVDVSYARTMLGQDFSPLFIQSATEPAPFLVPLLGETNHEGMEVEDFTQGNQNQLDVLFVLSNTTTMAAYQQRLAEALPSFMNAAAQQAVDLHVGVTTTGLFAASSACPGGAEGGEAGRLFPADGSRARWVTTDVNTLQQNTDVGTCQTLVEGLETMRQALSAPLVNHADDPMAPEPNQEGNLGFLREEARLAVVFVADEDDHSGFDTQSYVQFLQSLKGPGMAQRTTAYAIVPTDPNCITAGPPGPRFTGVAQQTGGRSISVCSQDYSGLLQDLATQAAGLQQAFRLAAVPTDPTKIQVTVNGNPSSSWTYDAQRNAVVFDSGSTPQPGDQIEVRYEAQCPPSN